MRPRVTVIIPTYNWSSVLPYSVGSVLRQTFTDFELLVVGDGCTDDSETVVNGMGDPRVRWINLPENTRHQSGPNNEGLRQAQGELIAYLGHDDLWLPHHLEVLAAALDRTGSDLAYGLGVNVVDDFVWPSVPRPAAGQFSSPLCMMHRKAVTDTIGGWRHYRELRIGPDAELWQRAQKAGCRFTFVPRLTGIKFPAANRRNVYLTRPSHEQAAWLARIDAEPDLEPKLLVQFIAGDAVPAGVPYRELLRQVVRQTRARLRMRFTLAPPKFKDIDAVRRYKGL
ncbi:MAG TPA: glycosyltransferase [Thermoanaerobaculia bacterium]